VSKPGRLPVVEASVCAACGNTPVERATTFLCQNQERYICRGCWGEGENDEEWDMETSNRIQLRDRKLRTLERKTKEAKR
jgi:hypothetical protein